MTELKGQQKFPRAARLHSGREFRRVFNRKLRAGDNHITLYLAENDVGQHRLGIAVGRRYGNAVRRNRIKRLIREAFRTLRSRLDGQFDWIIIPHPHHEPTLEQLRDSLTTLSQILRRRLESGPKH